MKQLKAEQRFVLAMTMIVLFSVGLSFTFFAQIYWVSIFMVGGCALLLRWSINFYRKLREKIFILEESLRCNDTGFRFSEAKETPDQEVNIALNNIKQLLHTSFFKVVEQERFFELLLANVNTGILVIDSKGAVTRVNNAAHKLLATDEFGHIDKLIQEYYTIGSIIKEMKGGERRYISQEKTNNGQQLVIECTTLALRDEFLRVFVISDIHEELDQKEFESWIRLIRVLTHEIMNALAPITSISETLSKNLPDECEEELREGLSIIGTTAKGLTSFVEAYRSMMRIPPPKKTLFYVEPLIERIIGLIKAEKGAEDIKFNLQVESSDLIVFADEQQIAQVLLNLLKNALQAVYYCPQKQITIQAGVNSEEQVMIEITDNGQGISPEIAEQIFVPFFTTKEQGSGIGLSVSQQIMRQHNGKLRLLNHSPGRTTFLVLFE